MSTIATKEQKPLSPWRLFALFIVACLIFTALRFDSESFVRGRIAGMAAAAGVEFNFSAIDVSGLSVGLHDLSIRSARIPAPLNVEYLSLSPSLGSLLTGDMAADVETSWQGVHAEAAVAYRDQSIALTDIHAAAAAADILALIEPYLHLPTRLDLAGDVDVSGEMILNSASGTPESGELHLAWQGAKGSAMGVEVTLGKVDAELQRIDENWKWQLSSVDNDLIRAEGAVRALGPLPARWPLSGDVAINLAAVNDPALQAWIPKQQAGKVMKLRLSGLVSMPRLTMVK